MEIQAPGITGQGIKDRLIAQQIDKIRQRLDAIDKRSVASPATSAQIADLQAQITALSKLVSSKTTTTTTTTTTGSSQTYYASGALTAFVPVHLISQTQVAATDSATVSTVDAVLGLTTAAAASGDVVPIAKDGDIVTNSAWAWTAFQPVYIGPSGSLTQTPPSTGYVLEVAFALSATVVLVVIGTAADPDGTLTANSNARLATQQAAKTYADTKVPLAYLDTDATLAANSDAKIPSQKAVATFVNSKVNGLSWKQTVRAATTAAHTLATDFTNGSVRDGVTLATGDRILIKNQAAAAENGIYTVNASGAPTRAVDADSGAELVNATCYVSEGTINADSAWTCTSNAPITVGTTALVFAQVGGNPSIKYSRGANWDNGFVPVNPSDAKVVYLEAPIAGVITAWEILTDGGTGSCVVDVWKAPFSTSSRPTSANSITGAAKPSVSAGINARSSVLTGWTTAIAAGDVLAFHLDSASNFSTITILLTITT